MLQKVGFFYSVGASYQPIRVQNGIIRTNCVDCLDRTNVAQFFMGREALIHQLAILAYLPEPHLDEDSQIVDILHELYELLGDHLSIQYGGSSAHKKYTRERPRMMKHSKEFLTSIQRHYRNSFTDLEKQHSTNLFLGILQPKIFPHQWLRNSDEWLHQAVIVDQYDAGYWWVAPLQFFFNSLRILYALPAPMKIRYFPLVAFEADAPRWFALYGGSEALFSSLQQKSLGEKKKWPLLGSPQSLEGNRRPSEEDIQSASINLLTLYTYTPWLEVAASTWRKHDGEEVVGSSSVTARISFTNGSTLNQSNMISPLLDEMDAISSSMPVVDIFCDKSECQTVSGGERGRVEERILSSSSVEANLPLEKDERPPLDDFPAT
ncbi:SacI domain-containing protein, partial [Cardiosporidium cionae]